MFSENLSYLRKMHQMTQEELAEKAGVSRQAYAKWESGDSLPDIEKCQKLAEALDVTMDDLVNYEREESFGLNIPPKGKHIFGVVTVGDKGQIVVPAKARRLFNIVAGDQMVVLGDEEQGIALIKAERFTYMADMIRGLSQEKSI